MTNIFSCRNNTHLTFSLIMCLCNVVHNSILGVPQKMLNGRFSVPWDLNFFNFLASLNKASSAEESDTKIIEFGWEILILWPFLETVIFKFCLIFATNEHRLCREWSFICPFPLTLCLVYMDQSASSKTIWKGLSQYNPTLIGRKNQQNLKISVSRNEHKIEITQPNSMILVSFSSA